MRTSDVASAAFQAALLGAMAAWLTLSFTNPLGIEWGTRDSGFVLAVMAAVFYHRIKSKKLEELVQTDHLQRLKNAHLLERVEFVHGKALQLETNKVTCILFFGTWCSKSREALQQFELLRKCITHGGEVKSVQFLALTQEAREELAMYEVKGRQATNFQELKDFSFSIAIEDGLMSKEYLVRCDLFKVPQLFVVAKDNRIFWYGDPTTKGIAETIRAALSEENVGTDIIKEEDTNTIEQATSS